MSITAMKQALEALELLARYENPETKIQVRKPRDGGPIVTMYPHKVATDAANTLRTAIAEAEKQESVEQDAKQWGNRLNDASWAAANAWNRYLIGPMSDAIFDNIKGVIRVAILKYLEGYTTPPAAQREWVGLTEAEINEWDYDVRDVVMDIEKLLREKNT